MELLTICPNDGEASLVTSMLEAEGIVCHQSENCVELDGPVQVRVFVDEADLPKAKELLDNLKRERIENPPEKLDPEPSQYYPFVGITCFLLLLWITARGFINAYWLWEASEFGRVELFSFESARVLFMLGLLDIVLGILPCGFIAYLGAVVAALRRKAAKRAEQA